MKVLISDLDGTLIKSKKPGRPSKNNWVLNIDIKYLSQFNSIFIVTNQLDHRIDLSYITDVVKLLKKESIIVNVIINKKNDAYRKPHVLTFIKNIKPLICESDTITWLGDQDDDYKYFCNCMLHYKKELCKYYNITNLTKHIAPIFIDENLFISDTLRIKCNTIIHMYLLDMISVVLSELKDYQIVKRYKTYYILSNSIYYIFVGKFTPIKIESLLKQFPLIKQYILNSENDSERIARYYQYVSYSTYSKFALHTYYSNLSHITSIIKLYPNIQNSINRKYFLELF